MKRALFALVILVVVALAAGAVTVIAVIKSETGRSVVLPGKTSVEVEPGESLRRVAGKLREADLVASERAFLWMAHWKGIDRTFKYGRHEFEGTVTLASVLDELASPPKPILRVTIPEGLTLREIGALLETAGAVPAASYAAVACSDEFRRAAGAPAAASCAEGFLFPDTYDLVPGMSPGEIVSLQLARFHQVVDPLLAAAPRQPPLPLDELLTLASIVEKETAQGEERPRIAAVFFNRLKAGMPLQTDPTVIYGVIDAGLPWDGNLTRAHLTTPTPYNTYMMKGLPPGPICNPGRASIDAVLHPASTGDLYFVARGDGSHEFSPNLATHNRAVREYQLGHRRPAPQDGDTRPAE